MNFSRLQTDLPGLVLIQAKAFHDPRGYFMELFNADSLKNCGIEENFLQDNLSYSSKGTLRGLHYQAPPHAQGKLVTVLQGTVLDVVLDIRKGSPTYGQCGAFELSEHNRQMLYVPPGFAHGFSVLSDTALFHYKCTRVYHKASEGGVLWNDPDLHVDWKVQNPIISDKDTQLPLLKNLDSPFTY
jgi:dTDP-4-dehydrorhamnose 3,5-epimerase